MTDASIVVGVEGRIEGGKAVKRSLDDIATSGERATKVTGRFTKATATATRTTDRFKSVLRTLATALSLRELQQASDRFVQIENRLRVVTNGAEEFASALTDVQKIAKNSRASLDGTANTYSRIAIATKNLGLSQQELGKVVQAINQTFRISGSTAQETAAASIQLAQGLAAGALRGDELRSVLENNIVLGNLLADAFDTDVGTLRKLAAEGAITSEVLTSTLLKAFDDLEVKAALLRPTLNETFGQLSNAFTVLIGQSEVVKAITTALANALIFVADNANAFGIALGTVTAAFVAYQVATRAAAVATGLFNATLALNPLGLFVAAIAAAGVAAYAFRDDIHDAMIAPIVGLITIIDRAIKSIRAFYNEVRFGFDRAVGSILVVTGQISSTDFDAILNERSKKRQGNGESVFGNFNEDDLGGAAADILGGKTGSSKAGKLGGNKGRFGKATDDINKMNEALKGSGKAIEDASGKTKDFEDKLEGIRKEVDRFSNSAAEGFGEFIRGAKSAKDLVRGLVDDLVQLASRELIVNPLKDIFGSILGGASSGGGSGGGGGILGSILGSAGSFIGSAFGFNSGGSMVLGGSGGIDSNVLSLNGAPIANTSRGETLSISPGGQSGGAGVVVNQTINVSTGVQETVRAEVLGLMPQIKETTIAGVREADARGIA